MSCGVKLSVAALWSSAGGIALEPQRRFLDQSGVLMLDEADVALDMLAGSGVLVVGFQEGIPLGQRYFHMNFRNCPAVIYIVDSVLVQRLVGNQDFIPCPVASEGTTQGENQGDLVPEPSHCRNTTEEFASRMT
jgi:hypothetical protein